MQSATTTVVLGKRKAESALVLHLSSKKVFKCNDCDKAYSKPSRLEEHRRSHTGQVSYSATIYFLFKFISVHMSVHRATSRTFASLTYRRILARISQTLLVHSSVNSLLVQSAFGPCNTFALTQPPIMAKNPLSYVLIHLLVFLTLKKVFRAQL